MITLLINTTLNLSRVGDRILSIDDTDVTGMTVDKVRNLLRGDPGTDITIILERERFPVTNSKTNTRTSSIISNDRNDKSIVNINMKRQQVKISDVSLATFLGIFKSKTLTLNKSTQIVYCNNEIIIYKML